MVIVSKYGGTSVAGGIDKIDGDIIVLSAPGTSSKYPDKVTKQLLALADGADYSLTDSIIRRYEELFPGQSLDFVRDELRNRYDMPGGLQRRDALAAFGEEACARLAAERLDATYVDPRNLFLVTSGHGGAKIEDVSEEMIRDTLSGIEGRIVIPGFFGYAEDGKIATFKRGGSDLTGAYIAAALGADLYENWTDTPLRVVNPEILGLPREKWKTVPKIHELTFKEMRDLAYSGFGILLADALKPVRARRIPVHLRDTFTPEEDGTMIVYDRISDRNRPIVGAAYKGGLCAFNISSFGLNDEVGILQRVTGIFAEKGASIEYMTTGIDDLSVILQEKELNGGLLSTIRRSIEGLADDMQIEFVHGLGAIVIGGQDIRKTKGLSAHVELKLLGASVDLRFISQGPAKRSIVYGIDVNDARKAIKAIYDEYLKKAG